MVIYYRAILKPIKAKLAVNLACFCRLSMPILCGFCGNFGISEQYILSSYLIIFTMFKFHQFRRSILILNFIIWSWHILMINFYHQFWHYVSSQIWVWFWGGFKMAWFQDVVFVGMAWNTTTCARMYIYRTRTRTRYWGSRQTLKLYHVHAYARSPVLGSPLLPSWETLPRPVTATLSAR